MLEAGGSEVEEESSFETCGFEVVDDLGFLDGGDLTEGFEFDDDGIVANEVGAIQNVERFLTVEDWNLFFSFEWDS